MIKKFFLTLLSAILVCGAGLYLFSLKKPSQTNEALNELLHGNFYLAESHLNPSDYFKLGLIRQKMGLFAEADALFNRACNQKNKDEDVVIAKLLNGLLQGKLERLPASNSCHLLFFQALCFYQEGHYQKAILAFEAYHNPKTSWLDQLIDSYFPADWIAFHLAHAEIELGDQNKARQRLENLNIAEANPLLAITYLKEEEETSQKVALYYLDQTKFQQCRFFDKKRVLNTLIEEVKRRENLVLPFLSILEKSNEKELFDEMSAYAVKLMFKKGHFNPANQILRDKIANHFISLLKTNNIKDLKNLFATLEKNNLLTVEAHAEFMASFEKTLTRSIVEDDESLVATKSYLDFFKNFASLKKEQPHIANVILHQGKLYWLKEGFEKKGTALLKLGIVLKDKRNETRKEIEGFFETQYQTAEGANLIGRLSLIYSALSDLGIDTSGFHPRGALGNYLADADYQFTSRNYSSAKAHAELILRIDPKNEDAKRLYGLSCYHTGLYKEAIAFLETLDSPDEYATKALNFSLAQANQKGEKQLVSLDFLDSLDENK